MAKSASASPPTSVSMWPASARSARLPVKSAPSTSTTRNAAVSPSVVRSRGRERAAAVGRCACAMTRIVAGFLLQSGIHHDRSLVLHGQRYHFLDWGAPTAPAVVLLHGITGHARTWDDEARALAARYRVLALDQRGHGDSDPAPDGDYTVTTMAADLAAFADALRLRHFSVVGLSMGGRVAIAFAGSQPERVERLIVVDIGPDIAPGGRLRVGAMACPTLVVRGAESDVLAPETVKRMLATNPHARLVEVDGAGHTVPGDQPAAFRRILVEFLAA